MGTTLRIQSFSTNSKGYSHIIMALLQDQGLMDNAAKLKNESGFKIRTSDFAVLVWNLREINKGNSMWKHQSAISYMAYMDREIIEPSEDDESDPEVDMWKNESENNIQMWKNAIDRLYEACIEILFARVFGQKKYVKFRWE